MSAFTYLPKRLLGGRSSEMRGAASLLDILAATSSSSIRTEVSALTKCWEASIPAMTRHDGELLLLPEIGPCMKSDACYHYASRFFFNKKSCQMFCMSSLSRSAYVWQRWGELRDTCWILLSIHLHAALAWIYTPSLASGIAEWRRSCLCVYTNYSLLPATYMHLPLNDMTSSGR